MDAPTTSAERPTEEASIPAIEAAVEDGIRRLRQEAELLEAELARRSVEMAAASERRAAVDLAELQEKVKRLADLPSADAGVED